MPAIDIQTYNLDFLFLTNNDPKSIAILDQSTYLSEPQLPLLQVIPPGFTGALQVPYAPQTITILNSDNLTLTDVTECGELADLPDGVWQITMMVCPYDELYVKKCYLKTTQFDNIYYNILLNYDDCSPFLEKSEYEKRIIEVDILIQSAHAEARCFNVDKATMKYQKALSILNSINKKLNCK